MEKYIKDNSVRVLYRVLIEAQSIDDDFSICKFCYNVQNGRKFRYSDGLTNREKFFLVKVVQAVQEKIISKSNETNNKKTYLDYSIDTKNKIFHLYDKKCKKLNDIEPRYIQETTATEKDLLNKDLKQCKKCIK